MTRIQPGDVLSESSHYKVQSVIGNSINMTHFESGQNITIDRGYVERFIKSADEVIKRVDVTKEDKKDGTLGIRSIWENIHSGQVFTVCFKKQDKPKSRKAIELEKENIRNIALERIETAKRNKKSMAVAYKEALEYAQENPVSTYIEGEERILRGYKIQFTSRDGKYDCVDMDITRTDKESGIRPVNINSILWLIFDGVQYVVK